MPKPLRLADIATHFGISTITASRALRRPHLVRPELVEGIRRFAAEHGYRVGGGSGGRTLADTAILYLVVGKAKNLRSNPYLAAVQRGLEAAGIALGVTVEQRSCLPERLGAELARLADDRRWRGVLLNPLLGRIEASVLAAVAPLPVAAIESSGGGHLPVIEQDHGAGRRELLDALRRIGARRPGCCIHPGSLADQGGLSAHALYTEWRAAGLEPVRPLTADRRDVPRLRAWLRSEQPDAVVCTYADTALAAWDAGRGTPACVIDHIDAGGPVAGLDQRRVAMGWLALRNLLWAPWETGAAYGLPLRILVPPAWVPGRTWEGPQGHRV